MSIDHKFDQRYNPMLNLYGRRPPGIDTEEMLFHYLKTKYPHLIMQFGSRKGIYDIYTTFADFDAVGVDKHYRLNLSHKDIKRHRHYSKHAGKPGFIAFMFPKDSGYWFFLPVSSRLITRGCGRPVIDGYLLAACVVDPILKGTLKISKAAWFKNTINPLVQPGTLPPGFNASNILYAYTQ